MTALLDHARQLPARALQFARTPRARKIAYWFAGIMAVIGVIGIFIVPPLVKGKVEAVLSAELMRKVTIGKLSVNPYTLSVTVEDFVMQDREGDRPAVTFARLYVNAEASSLPWRAFVLKQIRLEKPQVHVVRTGANTYNFSDVVEAFLAKPSGPTPRFSLHDIEVVDGRIDFDDLPEKKQHAITAINFGVPFVSSIPFYNDDTVAPHFSARINDDPVAVSGTTKPFNDSLETAIALDLDAFELPRYFGYSPIPLKFKLPSGELTTRLKLAFTRYKNKTAPKLMVSGDVSLAKFAIVTLDDKPVLTLPALEVSIGAADLVERTIVLNRVTVREPQINVQRTRNGQISLLALAPEVPKTPAAKPAVPEKPPVITIKELQVTNGTARFSDDAISPAFRGALEGIELTAADLSTAEGASGRYEAAMRSDLGMTLKANGTLVLAPLAVEGQMEMASLSLGRLYPYYAPILNLEVKKGSLDVAGTYKLVPGATPPVMQFSGGAIALRTLQLLFPGDKELLLNAPLLEVRDAEVDLHKQTVVVGEASGRDIVTNLKRFPDGSLHFAALLKRAPAADPVAAPATAPAAPVSNTTEWRILEKRVNVSNITVNFEDLSIDPPARLVLTQVAVTGENLSNESGIRGSAALRGTFNRKGTFALAGPLSLRPFFADLKTDVRNVELAPLQPYLQQFANIQLTSGSVTTRGNATVEVADGAPPKAAYAGDVSVNDLSVLETPNALDLLKWKSLALGKVKFTSEPFQAAVGEIALSDFYSRLIIHPDGTLNLQKLMIKKGGDTKAPDTAASAPPESKPAETPPAGAPATTGLPPNISIGKITLQGGNVNFTDNFIKPNYSANLTGVGGSISEMTPDKPADIELRAKLDNAAPVEILGRANPLAKDLFVDIKASARDIELTGLTPYAVKYAGYGIEKGKLSVNVAYKVENRKLSAENNIYLDQLTFGEKVDSPTATKLPVLFAVSLLKDRNGVIDINLPVSGSLDDPQFSIGGVIVRVIVNLFVKAVTSPFALIGAMFGGSEELAYIEFAPGTAGLDAAGDAKTKTLVKALADRPALKVDVTGRVDPAADREGLKRAAVDRQVRAQKLQDLAKAGKAPASADDVKVDAAEYPKYLAAAYSSASFPKPRNMVGMAKDLPVPEMEQLMLTNAAVADDDLRALANARAQAVKDALVVAGKTPADRVFIVAPKLSAEGIKDKGKPTRVDFSLR